MEIENCKTRVLNVKDAPSLLKEVKNLPKLEDAKDNVMYRDLNQNLWLKTTDGWQQINKDENSHVKAIIKGNDGVNVIASGTDNQTFIIDGKQLINQINESRDVDDIEIKGEPDNIVKISKAGNTFSIDLQSFVDDINKQLSELDKTAHKQATLKSTSNQSEKTLLSIKASGVDNQNFLIDESLLAEMIKRINEQLDKLKATKQDKITKNLRLEDEEQSIVLDTSGSESKMTNSTSPYRIEDTTSANLANITVIKDDEDMAKRITAQVKDDGTEFYLRHKDSSVGVWANSDNPMIRLRNDKEDAVRNTYLWNSEGRNYFAMRRDLPDGTTQSSLIQNVYEDTVSFYMKSKSSIFNIRIGENKTFINGSNDVVKAWHDYLGMKPKAFTKKNGNAVVKVIETFDHIEVRLNATTGWDKFKKENDLLKIVDVSDVAFSGISNFDVLPETETGELIAYYKQSITGIVKSMPVTYKWIKNSGLYFMNAKEIDNSVYFETPQMFNIYKTV